MSTRPTTVWFLRNGRQRRARGHVLETRIGLVKVQPAAKRWKAMWITFAEIAAGQREEQPKLKLR